MDKFPDDCYPPNPYTIEGLRHKITLLIRKDDYPFLYSSAKYLFSKGGKDHPSALLEKDMLEKIAKELSERGFVCKVSFEGDNEVQWYIEVDVPDELK